MIKNINTKKGISLIVLLITLAVILILLTTITFSADNIISNTKKRQFAKEIYEVQNLVDKYKYENDDYPYIIENDEKKVININVENIDEQFVGEDIINNTITLYPIDLSKAGVQNLSRGTKKDNNENDVYAFSNKTGRVYYVKGYKFRNNTYYTLTDELKSLIGYGSNEEEANSKVISEVGKSEYITDGLILYLDGINNTRNGHITDTNVWEDLSGNNYDVTMENIILNNNNMYFNGTDSKIYSNNSINAVSVEMVLELEEYNQYYYIASFGSRDKILAWNAKTNKGFSLGNGKNQYFVDNLYKLTSISVQYNPDKMYLNSERLEQNVSAESWGRAPSHPFTIGCYGTSNNYRVKGKIYAVRVYNKALTEEEIQHNYKVDKFRFGIN